jgi:serine protein kinase
MVKEGDLADDTRKQHLEFLQDVLHKEYLELLEKEITKAFVYSYQEQASRSSRTTSTTPRRS